MESPPRAKGAEFDEEYAGNQGEGQRNVRFAWLHPVKIVFYWAFFHLFFLLINLGFGGLIHNEAPDVLYKGAVVKANKSDICHGPNPVIGLSVVTIVLTLAVVIYGVVEWRKEGRLARPIKTITLGLLGIYYLMSMITFGVGIYYTDCMGREYLKPEILVSDTATGATLSKEDEKLADADTADAALAFAVIGFFTTLFQLAMWFADKLFN